MSRKNVDVAVIIPDASPIVTLARVERLDLFDTSTVPIHIVDQVQYEITKPASDANGRAADWLARLGNRVAIIETNVGVGFRVRRDRDSSTPSRNLGEIAVDEYATQLSLGAGPNFLPLVLFEDPDVLQTRMAHLPRLHLMNTAAWLRALADNGIVPDALAVLDAINARRTSPMIPLERPGRTRRAQSRWMKRHHDDPG